MAFGIKLVHTPKPRGYHHVNIYYDPEKEERDERENRVNKELNVEKGVASDPKEFKTSIKRGSFRRLRKYGDASEGGDVQAEVKTANRRFLIIVGVLLVIALLLWML